MTDEMFTALNFKKGKGNDNKYRWYSNEFHDIKFPADKDIEFEDIIRIMRSKWYKQAQDSLKYDIRDLLGINESYV